MARNFTLAMAAVGILFFLCGTIAADGTLQSQNDRNAVAAVNGLAADLYAKLAGERGNVCFSPYSISTAFAMTYAGADGDTAAEMKRALRYSDNIHASNALLMRNITGAPEGAGEISIANSIWPNKGYKLDAKFEKVLTESYNSEIATQDYEKNPDRSRNNINKWVEEKTRSRIVDLLGPGSVSSATRLVLVNAIYFKAPWMKTFSKGATGEGVFRSHGESFGVPMMNKVETVAYYENEDFRAIKMLYEKGAFSMSILLPVEDDGIAKIEKSLTGDMLDRMDDERQKRMADIYLPKFKIESQFNLNRAIRGLGVEAAFVPERADFSKMNGNRDLFISEAVHKAFVEVDEDGTEAAAATAVVMRTMSAPFGFDEPVEFRVDHPFIFAICDEISGAILFIGRVDDPR